MTAKQIAIIRSSWEAMKPDTKRVGFLMYDKLFNEAPFLRHLFDGDITTQACKLVAVVNFVVSKLHRLQDILTDIRDIGAKHSGYDISGEWYDTVGRCLINSIKEESAEWSEEHEESWASLYGILKEQMQLGQYREGGI